jgi:hypothetical protein
MMAVVVSWIACIVAALDVIAFPSDLQIFLKMKLQMSGKPPPETASPDYLLKPLAHALLQASSWACEPFQTPNLSTKKLSTC